MKTLILILVLLTLILTLLTLLLALPADAQLNQMTLVGQYDGEAAENFFGMFTTMGDFDGDGMDELVISADGWNTSTGKAYFYQYDQGWPVSPFMTVQGETTYVHYGWYLGNVGDISNDGLPDLGIPEGWGSNTEGRIDFYFGSALFDSLFDWILFPPSPTVDYGVWLDSCGDVNGDGGADFLMQATYYTDFSTAVEVYHGGEVLDSIPDWVLAPVNLRPVGVGDVNGDGYDDVMMLSSSAPAKLYFGGSPMDTIPDLLFYEYAFNAIGGGVGDVNGDSFADFCLRMRFPDSTQSYSALYFGGPEVDNLPDVILQNRYGQPWSSLHGIYSGDFNGDGFNDVVSATGDLSLGDIVYIYLGSPWFNPLPDAWVTIYSIIFDFGYEVSCGDVNGDGRDELLVSATNYNLFNQGRVYLYEGPETWIDSGAGVEPGELPRTPGWFRLDQNYPNPFNPATTITFGLPVASQVKLVIYDLQGRMVAELVNGIRQAGVHQVTWEVGNLPSGLYFCKIQAGNFTEVRKMVLLK